MQGGGDLQETTLTKRHDLLSDFNLDEARLQTALLVDALVRQ
jgi:hypothetical protein